MFDRIAPALCQRLTREIDHRVDVNESVVYATAAAPDGTVYIGTGDQGTVYSWRGGKLKKLAKLDVAAVLDPSFVKSAEERGLAK